MGFKSRTLVEGLEMEVPPVGFRSRAPVDGLGDFVPRS